MSFKIFSLQLTGRIKTVETIEKKREKLLADFEEFQQVETSDELKDFIELENWINSDDFKKRKNEINALNFKESSEYKQLKEFQTLSKAGHIKKYFKIADSADLKRFEKLKDSEKLGEFDKLYEYIKEGEFEKDKKEIKEQVFKGSVEEKHLIDFKKLDKSSGIKAYKVLHESADLKKHIDFGNSEKLATFLAFKNATDRDKEKQKQFKSLRNDREIKAYFKFEKAKKLRLYRETVDSHELKRYDELKTYVETDDFKKRETYLKDKKKFEKSDAYQQQQKFKNLAADADVKFVLKFEKSTLYKNYLDVKDSFDLKRYFELEEIINSEEFKAQKAYLEDKKKWEKSDEFAKQQDYLKQKEIPHIKNYFKYKSSSDFDFLKNWEITFEDDFSGNKLDEGKWSNVSFLANKLLGDNYLMPGDLHVFMNGKNIKTGGKLSIVVKKDKAMGKVWQMPAGFIPTEFEYTTDLVSTGENFWQEDGIFEAKIKFNPVKQVVSSVYLSGENNTPRINLMEMGTKNSVGISKLNNNKKIETNGLDIANLKSGKSYIFAVEKNGNNLSWKINEVEVFASTDSTMNFPLQLTASSIVVHDVPAANLPYAFEIDWVKCYRKK